MIVTVTPNPALDMTWRISDLHVGESHRPQRATVRAGGKGVNVARVATQQNVRVVAIATVGGSTGDAFAADLRKSGIAHRLVPITASTRRTAAIVQDDGTTTMLSEVGEALSADEWTTLEEAVENALPDATVLVVSGSLPAGAPADICPRLIALARARGIPTIVDTSGSALLAAAAAGADILKPNLAEALEATGESDAFAAAEALLARGAEMVVLSLGADGMIAMSRGEKERPLGAQLPCPLIGNATGAGDAAVAALASELARGERRLEPLLRAATAWSAAAVLMPLAGEISPRHVELAAELIIYRPHPSFLET